MRITPDEDEEPVREKVRDRLPITVQQAMDDYFENNMPLGDGDLRAPMKLEVSQRIEGRDYWIVNRKRLSREEVMQAICNMVCDGFSLVQVLRYPGMPRNVTVMNWFNHYPKFKELFDKCDEFRAHVLVEQAMESLWDDNDPKQAKRDNDKANLNMRIAESLNPKKYGKKAGNTDPAELPGGQEAWDRLANIMMTHKEVFEAKTGIKLERIEDAEIIKDTIGVEEAKENVVVPVEMEGIEGDLGE